MPDRHRSAAVDASTSPGRARCTVSLVVARADVDAADRRISPGMVLVAAVALPMLPILHLANRLSTRRTLAVVARLGRLPFPRIACHPRRVGRAVNGVARVIRLRSTTCIARSQLIWLILSLCGRRPVIRVGAGVGLGAGTLAHAWVELDGVPGGRPDRRRRAASTLRPPAAGPGRLNAQARSQ